MFRLSVLVAIVLSLIVTTNIGAQLFNNTIDKAYIEPLDSKLVLGGQIGSFTDSKTFRIKSPEFEYSFESNVEPTIGIYVKYEKLPGLKVSFPVSTELDGVLAKTKGISLGLHFAPIQNVVADLYYSKLSRFNYLPIPFDRNGIEPFNDVKSTNMAVNAYYVFNSEKFSYRSTFDVGQKQIKNAGSWMVGLSLNNTSLEKTSSILRDGDDETIKLSDFRKFKGIQAAFLFGFMHNWTLGKKDRGFISAGLFFGPNFHKGELSYIELPDDQVFGVNNTTKALVSAGIRFIKGTQIQFKVFFNDYGYNWPGVDFRNNLIDGELSIVRYLGLE